MKNLLTILLLFLVHFMNGQTTTLKGIVTDTTGEVLMFANVAVYQNGKLVTGIQSDLDGKYQFDSLAVGTYDVEASYVGYTKEKLSNINLLNNKTVTLNIKMLQNVESCPVRIETYPLLINYWDLTQGTTFSSDDIQRSPYKN